MDPRRLAVSAAISTGVVLFFAGVHRRGHLPPSLPGDGTVAQAASVNTVQVKNLPNFGSATTQRWEQFEITAPTTTVSLDMRIGFLVDGHGTEYVTQRQAPWPHPIPARLWVDCGDYRTANTLSASPRQPLKEQKVTFDFVAGRQISFGENKTLTFVHGTANVGVIEVSGSGEGAVGDKIPLYDREIEDTSFRGYSQKWQDVGYVSNFPPGMVHRVTVYIRFLPHQGPPMRTIRVSKRAI